MDDNQAATQEDAASSVLDVQIIDIDSYMAVPVVLDCKLKEPYNIFEEPLKKVPVIRIFGATKSRQRICLHVHQAWPYMYVRYAGPHDPTTMREFGYQLGLSLNHALNIALKGKGMLFVAAVIPVKGIPFYGYHVGYQPFLKILLSNPKIVSRASSLLASGAVMRRKMDTFESHLPYTLQFLVDYNLYGMGWIQLDNILFRSPLPNGSGRSTDEAGLITDSTVRPEHRWIPQGMPSYLCNPYPPERVCRSKLEADIIVADIINRRQIPERQVHHKLYECEFKDQPERLVHSLRTIWADESARRIRRGMPSLHSLSTQATHVAAQSDPKDVIALSTPRDKPETLLQWPNHWRAQSMLQSMLASDRLADSKVQIDFSAWICSWPTCREVDIGDVPLLAAGAASPTRFYINNAESVTKFQLSGVLVSQPLCRSSSRNSNGDILGAAHESISSQDAGPVVVDIDLATKTKAGECSAGIDMHDDDGNSTDNYGYNSDAFAADSDSGSMGGSEMCDLDEAWMEEEIIRAERNVSSDDGIAGASIPQVDGAGDTAEGESTRGKCKKSKRQHREAFAYKRKSRKLQPLTLYSSKESTTASSSDEGASIDKGQIACYSKSQRDGDDLFELADKADRDVFLAHRRNAHMLSRAKRDNKNPDSSIPSSRRRGSGVYIDISHPEGSIVRAYRDGVANQMQATSASVSDLQYMAGDFCRPFDDDSMHHGSEQHESGSQRFDLHHHILRQNDFFVYKPAPPGVESLLASFAKYGIAERVAQLPYFSDQRDVPKIAKVYLGSAVGPSSNSMHQLPVFDPTFIAGIKDRPGVGFGDNGNSQTDESISQATERRYMMWSHSAVQQTNPHNMDARDEHSKRCSHTDLCSGWWVYSPRAPSHIKNPPYSGTRPDSTRIASPTNVHISYQSNAAATQTSVSRRKRDQTDIKWNSVLGSLLPSQGSCHIEYKNADMLGTPTKISTSAAVQRKVQSSSVNPTGQHRGTVVLSQLSMELVVRCYEGTPQSPQRDMILCIAACFLDNRTQHPVTGSGDYGYQTILWTCGLATKFAKLGLPSHIKHTHYEDELDMINDVARHVCRLDPDIICGYEVENSSWGYLVQRSQSVYGIDFGSALSRISTNYLQQPQQAGADGKGRLGSNRKHIGVNVSGRHALNLWSIMRSELSLTSYTFENVVKKVLGERVARYSPATQSAWLLEGPVVARIRVLRHLCYRSAAVLRVLDKASIVDRAAEFASVIGVDFLSVITRGSQYRVESLMARIAHPELFVLSSPTREQVAQQRAAECLPLVLEPKSRYYTDPIVVLDFQSLYPSIMIAYNYCFSTCLGGLGVGAGNGSTERRFGFTSMAVPPGLLNTLGCQNIAVSPNGVMFVKSSVRKGLLGRMLEEILESRDMLKESINLWGDGNEALHKKLYAWQLGLKLIANVTYGYTGASFSGRMPCVEVADAIVQTGRETLENAIQFIQSKHSTWGAEVVYGDTDSIFVHFPGKTRQTAYRLGHEIADAVTKLNPQPVKLKFEKVYQPSLLLTKKRYAGWMYTSVDQVEPQLDVKGMELVRRDGCGIQQHILEGAIDMLFRENDLSLVKLFVTAQMDRVLRNDVPIEDFIIAKEVRLGAYSGRTLPAHAKVAMDMSHSKQAGPLHRERVPYIVTRNGACTRLNDQVISPLILLQRSGLRIDYYYYIEKQIIPALDRVFGLVGVDVRTWFNDMPRYLRHSIYDAFTDTSDSEAEGNVSDRCKSLIAHHSRTCVNPGRSAYNSVEQSAAKRSSTRTLETFYLRRSCMLCQQTIPATSPFPARSTTTITTAARPPVGIRICERCWFDRAATSAQIGTIYRNIGGLYKTAIDTCIGCVGGHRASALQAAEACECIDCPVLFQKRSLSRQYQSWNKAASALGSW